MRTVHRHAAGLLAVALLLGVTCAPEEEPGAPSSGSTVPAITPSPASRLVLRPDGLGEMSFGQPMPEVMPVLVGLLGRPDDSIRMHGDLPLGYDGLDSTARWVSFGGLRVLFGDWAEAGREAGSMRFYAWDVSTLRAPHGLVLATSEGIHVGSTVVELRAAFGAALHLPIQPRCESPPWYWGVDPDLIFLGSLSARPSDPGARVETLHAGAIREGVAVDECW